MRRADAAGGPPPQANPELTEVYGRATTHTELQGSKRDDSGRVTSEERVVRVLHGPDNPLALRGTPDESALYEQAPVDGMSEPGAGGDWLYVTEVHGSVAEPNRRKEADNESLFIDGQPDVRDIKQGGLGTCYILGALNATGRSRSGPHPAHGEGVRRRGRRHFYRYDEAADAWTEAPIAVDRELLHVLDEDGEILGVAGARPRIADEPKRTEWYADVEGGRLSIEREDVYEASLWAPLVEKAYARYAENYGQYGGSVEGPELDDEGSAVSGYEVVSGGFTARTYEILYGPNVDDVSRTETTYTPGEDPIAGNEEALEALLSAVGVGAEEGQKEMATVRVGRSDVLYRLWVLTDELIADPKSDAYPAFRRELEFLRTLIQQWFDDVGDEPLERVAGVADRMRQPGEWPILHSDRADKRFRDLNELLNIAALLGSDASRGQRFVYAHHVYVVLGLAFCDRNGEELEVTLDNLAQVSDRIDPIQSVATLRNPHGRNAPNERGGEEDQGDADGIFELTLDQLFRAFSDIDVGVVND